MLRGRIPGAGASGKYKARRWRFFGWLGGGTGGGEVGKLGANALDHREDEFFDLLGLDLGFGEELGWSEAELGHLGLGDFAAGVDDQRQGAEGGLLAEPLHQGK